MRCFTQYASPIQAILALVILSGLTGCTSTKKQAGFPPVPKEKFHLYLLIGQSNMAGRGVIEEQDRQPHPRVFALDKNNKWAPAVDPIHFDKPVAGVGPGLTFGRVMADRKPGVYIGLIPCAAGGSSIIHWKRGVWFEQTKSHPYDDAIERTKIAMKQGVLKGILWHQGEGDSSEELAPVYEQNLTGFIAAIRQDLGAPDVPFVAGQLGELFMEEHPFARVVNDALTRLPQNVSNTTCVDVKGFSVKEDNVHFNSASAREFGRRYAEAMLRLEK